MKKLHILDFMMECWYGIKYPFVALMSFLYTPQWYRNPYPTKGTIVIVFCWFSPNTSHYKWVSYLEKKGYRTYLVNLPLLFENFHQSAGRLDQFIKKHKLKKYTLVGISNGALVCLYYLHGYKKWKEIYRFISVGGPLRGTPTAWFLSFCKKGREMLPRSKFIRELENSSLPKKKVFTISAQYDELVPRKYSQIAGNTSYILPVWGHNQFHLDNKKTYHLISKLAQRKARI